MGVIQTAYYSHGKIWDGDSQTVGWIDIKETVPKIEVQNLQLTLSDECIEKLANAIVRKMRGDTDE